MVSRSDDVIGDRLTELARERDCSVPYDDIYFADVPADDDREGSR